MGIYFSFFDELIGALTVNRSLAKLCIRVVGLEDSAEDEIADFTELFDCIASHPTLKLLKLCPMVFTSDECELSKVTLLRAIETNTTCLEFAFFDTDNPPLFDRSLCERAMQVNRTLERVSLPGSVVQLSLREHEFFLVIDAEPLCLRL